MRSEQLESKNGHNHALQIFNIDHEHEYDINTLSINIIKVRLVLNQLVHVRTCAKSCHLNEDDTFLTYYITIILMHVDTKDKSLSTPSYLSMA